MASLFKFNNFQQKAKTEESGQVEQINERDGVETNSERLLPGQSPIERLRWILGEGNTGLLILSMVTTGRLVYVMSPITHLHLIVWLVLLIYVAWVGIERLNALVFVRSWSLFSMFVIGLVTGIGLAVQMGWIEKIGQMLQGATW